MTSPHVGGLSLDGGLTQNSYLSSLKNVVAAVIRGPETTPGWGSDELTARFS